MRLPRLHVHIQHNACARSIVQVSSFELLIMRNFKIIFLIFFTACAVAAGVGVYWLSQNEGKAEAAILEALSERLKTDGHIESIHLDAWSSFPHISLVLNNVHILGSGDSPDTLLQSPSLSLECNAWKLVQGQYELRALRIENAEIQLTQDAQGVWNTDVWKSPEDSSSTSLFAIDELSIDASNVIVKDRRIAVDYASASLAWFEGVLTATGSGRIGQIVSPDWNTSVPLTWDASCTYDASANELKLSMEKADWMQATWESQLTYGEAGWTITGETQGLSVNSVLELVPLPDPWIALKSDAKANGKWSWENDVFKSNWQINPSHWRVPLPGEPDQNLDVDASGKLWLKYENSRWRADLPALKIKTGGLQWQGTINDFLLDRGTFKANGTGEINWVEWDAMPLALQWTGSRPQTGTASWTGTIAATGNGLWSAEADWNALDWRGTSNETSWAFNGSGKITDAALVASDFAAEWDASHISGNLSVPSPLEQWRQKTSQLEATVQVDHWAFTADENDSENPISLVDLQLPAGADWTIQASVSHLQYGLWAMENVEAIARLTRDVWTVKRFSAATLSGELRGDAIIEFPSAENAIIIAHPNLSGCDLHELFFAFEDFHQKTLRAEHLTGTFGASGSVQFEWIEDVRWQPQTLDVLGTVSLERGTLKNLEAFGDIADYLKENRMMAPLVDPEDLRNRLRYVEIEDLESAVYISKESVQLPQVDIRSSAMNISLEGAYGLDESLDYTMGFAMRDLRNSRNDEFGRIEDDGLGQQFFIAMEGTLDEPKYSWDRDAQKSHRRENLQREKELLKTLFRRSSN